MEACGTDALIEIFIRLPPKAVFKVRCVSKRWNIIITDPSFFCRYDERDRGPLTALLGFFQSTLKYVSRSSCPRPRAEPPIKFLPIKGSPADHVDKTRFRNEIGFFICSSNGLILSGRHPKSYYVCNPLTKRWISLPVPSIEFSDVSVGFFCSKTGYEVVRTGRRPGVWDEFNFTLPIETYYSETKSWIQSILVASSKFGIKTLEPPVVLRGIFHWYAWRDVISFHGGHALMMQQGIAVYDPNYELGPAGENQLHLIDLPRDSMHSDLYAFTRSGDDTLWCGKSRSHDARVWILPKAIEDDHRQQSSAVPWKEWSLMYTVTSYSLWNDFPLIVKKRENPRVLHTKENAHLHWLRGHSLGSVTENEFRLEAFVPENPHLIILRDFERIYLFNLETRMLEPIQYGGRPIRDAGYDWVPFFESTFISTHTLI